MVFRDAQSLRARLTKLTETDAPADKPVPQPATRVAFVYTGEGSQWVGMGEALYDSEPVVRAVLDHCDAVVRAERGASLLDVMFGRAEATSDLNDAAWAQPALYALECALTALWASVGVRPHVALGYGTGEIAAAQAAGVFTLEDGLRFALTRGTLMAALPGVDPNQSLNGLEAAFAEGAVSPPSLTLVSGVTGRVVDADNPLDGAYWRTQARETAAFSAGVSTLAELGVEAVVEIGPDAVLGPQVSRAWPDSSDGEEAAFSPLGACELEAAHPTRMQRRAVLGLWKRLRGHTRRDWRFPLRACSPGSRAAASRCRAIRSSAGVTGCNWDTVSRRKLQDFGLT